MDRGAERLLQWMRRYDIPLTRENFIALNWGEPVPELTAEDEAVIRVLADEQVDQQHEGNPNVRYTKDPITGEFTGSKSGSGQAVEEMRAEFRRAAALHAAQSVTAKPSMAEHLADVGIHIDSQIARKWIDDNWERLGIDAAKWRDELYAGYGRSSVHINAVASNPNDPELSVGIYLHNDENETKGSYQFSFYPNSSQAYMGSMALGDKGTGVAKRLGAATFELFEKIGIKLLETSPGLTVGGYAWARYGFTPDAGSWRSLQRHMQERVESAKSMSQDNIERTIMKYAGDLDKTPAEARALFEAVRNIDPETERLLHDDNPRAIWPISDSPAGPGLLLGSSWHGFLRTDDPQAVARARAYIAGRAVRAAAGAVASAIAHPFQTIAGALSGGPTPEVLREREAHLVRERALAHEELTRESHAEIRRLEAQQAAVVRAQEMRRREVTAQIERTIGERLTGQARVERIAKLQALAEPYVRNSPHWQQEREYYNQFQQHLRRTARELETPEERTRRETAERRRVLEERYYELSREQGILTHASELPYEERLRFRTELEAAWEREAAQQPGETMTQIAERHQREIPELGQRLHAEAIARTRASAVAANLREVERRPDETVSGYWNRIERNIRAAERRRAASREPSDVELGSNAEEYHRLHGEGYRLGLRSRSLNMQPNESYEHWRERIQHNIASKRREGTT